MKDKILTNGFVRFYDDGVWRYRGPDGRQFTTRQYNEMVKNGKVTQGSVIPEPNFQEVEPESEESETWELPEPKPKANRTNSSNSQKANAKELALAFEINLSIITAVLALVTSIPELEMTDQEAGNISVAAANLFESSDFNKKFGKLIANSGDYSMLGYALYLYIHRVVAAVKERNPDASRPKNPFKKAQSSNGTGAGTGVVPGGSGSGDGGVTDIAIRGAALHGRPAGLRGFTPLIG